MKIYEVDIHIAGAIAFLLPAIGLPTLAYTALALSQGMAPSSLLNAYAESDTLRYLLTAYLLLMSSMYLPGCFDDYRKIRMFGTSRNCYDYRLTTYYLKRFSVQLVMVGIFCVAALAVVPGSLLSIEEGWTAYVKMALLIGLLVITVPVGAMAARAVYIRRRTILALQKLGPD
jgi:hypothetical protein